MGGGAIMQKQCENVILELTVRNHPGVATHALGSCRRAFNVEGILCLPIQERRASRIWLLVNDDQRLEQMMAQIDKLEDVTKVARNQSDPTMFNKIAVFLSKSLKVRGFCRMALRLSGLQDVARRPDKAFAPPSGAFRHQDQTMTTIALYRRPPLIVRSGFAQLFKPRAGFSGRGRVWLRTERRWRVCRDAGAGLYLRYLNAGPLRAGAVKPAPKGMATIMLSVHDGPALVEQALNAGGARVFLSKRCSPDELIAAVRTVSTGGCYLTPDIAISWRRDGRIRSPDASARWQRNFAQGMSVKEIAVGAGAVAKDRSRSSRQPDGKTQRQ